MAKILVTGVLRRDTIEKLEAEAELVLTSSFEHSMIAELLKDCDALIVVDRQITASLIAFAPKLQCIASVNDSINNIDVHYATDHKIPLLNVSVDDDVDAETCLADAVLDILAGGAPMYCVNLSHYRSAERPAVHYNHHEGNCSCCR